MTSNATKVDIMTDTVYGAKILVADFDTGVDTPLVELTSRFQTRASRTNGATSMRCS